MSISLEHIRKNSFINFNTSSDVVLKHDDDTKNRLNEDPGFKKALEIDSEMQRTVERKWTDEEFFDSSRVPFGGSDDVADNNSLIAGNREYNREWSCPVAGGKIVLHASDLSSLTMSISHRIRKILDWKNSTDSSSSITVVTSSTNTDDDNISLLHEGVVRIFGLNSLRFETHAFPFLMGIEETTSQPPPPPPKKRGRGCKKVLETAVVVASPPRKVRLCSEYIPESVTTLKISLSSSSFGGAGEFLSIILQTALSLKAANDENSFTHYNLNTENVLLRKVSSEVFYIPYSRGNYFVASGGNVVLFSDFSRSHATLKNSEMRSVSFGLDVPSGTDLISCGVFRDRPNPMTDVYKLLLHSYKDTTDTAVKSCISELLKYFNQTETPDQIISAQEDITFLYLPLTTKTRAYSLDEFITYTASCISRKKWNISGDPIFVEPDYVPPKSSTASLKNRDKCFSLPYGSKILPVGAGLTSKWELVDYYSSVWKGGYPIPSEDSQGISLRCSKSSSVVVVNVTPPVPEPIVTETTTTAVVTFKATTPSTSDSTPRIILYHGVPDTFQGFYDLYSHLLENVEGEEDSIEAKNLSTAFTKGFSSGVAPLNSALVSATELLDWCENEIAEVVSRRPLYTPAVVGVSDSDSISKAAIVFTAYSIIQDIYKTFRYTVALYWKSVESQYLPDDITDFESSIESIVGGKYSRLLSVVNSLVEKDLETVGVDSNYKYLAALGRKVL